jgi:beta-lactam-binding protein with PASTA domain
VAGVAADDSIDPYVSDQPLGPRPISFLLLLGIVVAMMVVVSSMFLDRVGLAAVASGPTLVEVPQLTGVDRATAEALLTEAGLAYVISEKQNVSVEPGLVIEQQPLAGERVTADSTVQVTLSTGDDFTRVPDIRGSPRSELELLLMVHGLYLGDIGHQEDDRALGEVIGQFPAPGELAPRGTPVHVMLSAGPPMIEVPDVRNLSEVEARRLLMDAGFLVTVQERSSYSVPRGSAMSTDPADEAPRGSRLVLYVSRGAPPTTTTTPPAPDAGGVTTSPTTVASDSTPNRGRGRETYAPFDPSQ